MAALQIACYTASIASCIIFGCIALLLSHRLREKNKDAEFFITARGSQTTLQVACTFYAANMGAWTMFSIPSYATTAGLIGIVFYCIALSFPIFFVAFVGGKIQRQFPRVLSFSHYAYLRFGPVIQGFVGVVMLFNMGVNLSVCYTSIGDFFESIVGASRILVILVIACSTLVYTATGGLIVSLITDQIQALSSLVFVVTMVIYVAVSFPRKALEDNPFPNSLKPDPMGYGSIGVMPISMIAWAVYYEGMWQRVWASANDRSLKYGVLLSGLVTILVLFFFGFCACLVIWAKWYPEDNSDSNTVMFLILSHGMKQAPTWILTFVALLASTMCQSAVDGYQNALVDCVTSILLKGKSMWWGRLAVLIINIPIIIVALEGYPVLNLYLLANLVATCCGPPVLLGTFKQIKDYVTTASVLFGCFTAFMSILVYGYLQMDHDVLKGLHYCFFVSYNYPQFVIALCSSVIGVFVWGVPAKLIFGPPECRVFEKE
ncbi:hypothetical protein K493DRAFT_409134 [Basidiobolus meristosporus CBS 931.73]|uniref:Na+/solute symporter n=1 Tax=Basidiobolus meristosporus CBS 931.73 TaxID=1314790 RepID=A0A1Y1Y2G8_9FUNG|nr:hypothetical protein K493DRAFT_409134 [Basidiobolus meristosporus CBS 931.73]|eukprot:ORX91814.1 hypothetical protein K493DRAFT_409134 [Basidiobolus meristosporus CBS 931.73]